MWTSIGALSEVLVGGRRGADSDSDWGEHLRTTGPGPHTTLDLTHLRNSLGHMTRIHCVPWGTGTPKDKDEVNRREVCECYTIFYEWMK